MPYPSLNHSRSGWWSSQQPDLVEDVPTHSRKVGLDELSMSLPTLNYSMILNNLTNAEGAGETKGKEGRDAARGLTAADIYIMDTRGRLYELQPSTPGLLLQYKKYHL